MRNYNFLASPDPESQSESESESEPEPEPESNASITSPPDSNMDPIDEDEESYMVGPRMLRARRSKKSMIFDSDDDFADDEVDIRGMSCADIIANHWNF